MFNPQWSWKYEVGDLICCPRNSADEVWGSLIIMKRMIDSTTKYYECWSQKANRMISMPKDTLEKGWYVPKEKEKEVTKVQVPS